MAPTDRARLGLYVGGSKVLVTDISLGGVRFVYDVKLPLVPDLSLDLRFYLAGEDYAVPSRILRIAYNRGRFRTAVAVFTRAPVRFEAGPRAHDARHAKGRTHRRIKGPPGREATACFPSPIAVY